MELFKSLEKRTKLFSDPFKHFEINQPLTQNAIDEICSAEIADPRKQNLNYDGTRALDGGEGAFRAGIKDGGKAKKIRCYVTKENSDQFPNLTTSIVFVNLHNESENLGTDFYDAKLNKVKTVPYKHNYGYFFTSGPNTWHGMEKKEIKKERRCIQINYVTFETDWKVKS